ncbi:hypothetical protein [Gordonia malaquae]|uniref:hypothetical protein n=1 Tax=Gordonia malaquae TaxID=410332 RepID=UPI003015A6F4
MTATILEFPGLEGRQEPHHLQVTPAFAGSEKHGDAACLLQSRVAPGKRLFPWQDESMHATLRWNPETGLWTHSTCVIIVPRQNGKSEILLYRALYGLFVLGETIVFSVQRWKTGKKIADRFFKMVRARSSLRRHLAKAPTMSAGQAEMVLNSGASISFITRSPDSGTGFEGVDLVIYDEAYNLSAGDKSALDPTQLASPNPQRIFASSAVNLDIHANGVELTALREEGLAGNSEGLYLAEWMAAPNMDRLAPATWRYANPSYGIIQTDAKMRDALRGQTTQRARTVFDVNYLGRGKWPRLATDVVSMYDDTVLDHAESIGAADDLVLQHSIALSVDRSYAGREWSIAAAQLTADDQPYLELGFTGTATNADIVAKIKAVVDAWDPVVVVIDNKSPAKVLVPLLVAAGIEPVLTHAGHIAAACKGIEDDLLDEQLAMATQPVLRQAWTAAAKRTMPMGDWAWDRVDGGETIAPLVAATLARWGLLTYGLRTGGTLPTSPAHAVAEWETSSLDMPDFDPMAAGF